MIHDYRDIFVTANRSTTISSKCLGLDLLLQCVAQGQDSQYLRKTTVEFHNRFLCKFEDRYLGRNPTRIEGLVG